MKDRKPLSNEEIASFCSQAAMLFQAGITPSEGMQLMLTDAKSADAHRLLQSILDVCMEGEPFYKALDATGVFPDYVIQMLNLGEESGNLDVCMLSLAAYYEKEQNIADSVKNAVAYPAVMLIMMFVVIFVLLGKVMPIFNQVYIELGSEMTGFPASLLKLGSTLSNYSIAIFAILCVLAALCLFCARVPAGRKAAARFFQKLPLTRRFYESVACQRFASGMAMTLRSGMDTFSSLDMISRLTGSSDMSRKIDLCKTSLQNGDSFAEALTASGIFNHLYAQMVGIGFRSGNIDNVLDKIAENYEKETERRITGIISILEPTLVIILSVIVGLILLSVILPLMGIMTSIG